ncbi:MAG: polyphosphate kinase 1, partial [Spirochaetaceae bacterium]|nr:polyphosphate kinase 1 [Spirochaetaceae bacterium]
MKTLHSEGYSQNRELSWLKFNQRVLEEGMDETVPLLERLKFISIFNSNLDEFFMIRVGSLFDMMEYNNQTIDSKSGMSNKEQLVAIYKTVGQLYKQKEQAYFEVASQLRLHHIENVTYDKITKKEEEFVKKYYENTIFPILSPQIVDSRHPFPHLSNMIIHIGAMLNNKENELFSVIAIPTTLPSKLFLKDSEGIRGISIENIIVHYYDEIFSMYKVKDKVIFRVTRNGDISFDDEAFEIENDFRKKMKKLLQRRKHLAAVRLELSHEEKGTFVEFLKEKLILTDRQIFVTSAPMDLKIVFDFAAKLPTATAKRTLCYTPFSPQKCNRIALDKSLIEQLRHKDLLLSFPFESMEPYLKLVKEAADSPKVVSIKITIYRLASQAKLVDYLCYAAENGKEVVALIELRARFDEQNNIDWSQRLESSGCKVSYGFEGFKVHSKITLITIQERGVTSYITQVGTGNFNEVTAKLYTDLSFITSKQDIGTDTNLFFKNMAIGNLNGVYKKLLIAPDGLKPSIINLIDREISKGEKGSIIIKINSITDVDIIERLKLASCNNVKIKMIIRGICCLVPGVPGKTDNIEIRSIVGRYLEHSRIYCFGSGNDELLYISSADFMTRNTERRVEIACPIIEPEIKKQIHHILDLCLKDNVKSRLLMSNGEFRKDIVVHEQVDAQKIFMKEAIENAKKPMEENLTPEKKNSFAEWFHKLLS